MRINRNENSAGNQTPRPAPQPQQKAAPAQPPREKKEEPETPRPARTTRAAGMRGLKSTLRHITRPPFPAAIAQFRDRSRSAG